MNERIKQLAEQAGWDLWEGRAQADMTGCETELQKFAELIVRGCIDTAFHRGHPDLEFLLKHFGVEE
jgi:hypothetical protein